MPKTVSQQRPKDPRRTARLTGAKPLAYDFDRHGDLVGFDGPDDVDLGSLVGDRWLARAIAVPR